MSDLLGLGIYLNIVMELSKLSLKKLKNVKKLKNAQVRHAL